MLTQIKLEDVFTFTARLSFNTLKNQFLNHFDQAEGTNYVVFIKRGADNTINDVVVALVKGSERAEDIKARLFFRFGSGFSFEYNCEETTLSAAELKMEKSGQLHLHMLARLAATQLIQPTFVDQLTGKATAHAAAAVN